MQNHDTEQRLNALRYAFIKAHIDALNGLPLVQVVLKRNFQPAGSWVNPVNSLNLDAYIDTAMRADLCASPGDPMRPVILEPVITNPRAPGSLKVGDYVFASRWSDCDPSDPWAVGFVAELGDGYVQLAESPGIQGARRWKHAMRISTEQGWAIVASYPELERSRAPLDYEQIARIFGVDA